MSAERNSPVILWLDLQIIATEASSLPVVQVKPVDKYNKFPKDPSMRTSKKLTMTDFSHPL